MLSFQQKACVIGVDKYTWKEPTVLIGLSHKSYIKIDFALIEHRL
jgi:hypothetical protein